MEELRKEVLELKSEVEKIKARNARVEADKAWETSHARTLVISVITFGLVYLFSVLIERPQPVINAIFGAIAYLLSTSSYSILKRWWLKRRRK